MRVDCSRSLLKLIALQDESSEWEKIKHVQQLKAYGHKKGEEEKWYIYYTKEPYSFDAYLGESTTGDFIFDQRCGFIVVNRCKSHKMDSFTKSEFVCLHFAQE